MKHITRKKFLGILAAAVSSTVVGSVKNDDGLDDIYDDKYYVLKGGKHPIEWQSSSVIASFKELSTSIKKEN